MKEYSVELTDSARDSIRKHARYIAIECESPLNAQRWLERIWDVTETLRELPHRGAKAEENAYVKYDVRQMVVGSHLLLYSIDDEQRKVWVLGIRHGHRLPRPDELPSRSELDES